MGPERPQERLPLRTIIARAVALETDDPRLTRAEIRAIASELDISPDAVEAALSEATQSPSAAPIASTHTQWGVAATVLAGAGAAGLSITLAAKVGGADALVTTALFSSFTAAALNLWHATRVRGRTRYAVFNVVNAATWLAVGIGVAPMIIDLAPIVFGIGCATGGTLLIAMRDRRQHANERMITASPSRRPLQVAAQGL